MWILALGVALASDFVDFSDDVSDEICVEYERPVRRKGDTDDRGPGYAVPDAWARVRDSLGRRRWPDDASIPPAEFVEFASVPDPPPEGQERIALVVETAPHPLRSDRVLVRVGLRTRDPQPEELEPIHLVALVNVGHTMRSVPTRAYPMLQNQLPEVDEEGFFYDKVDRLSLARQAIRELVDGLPKGSRIAVAAFDRGARIALQPTSTSKTDQVGKAIDGLEPGLDARNRGLDLVVDLVRRMRSFCGDTRVVVFSDGPTGLGGDPENALVEVAEEASRGVTFSTVATAVGLSRVPQLEQLAYVGYGRHHHADTLDDAVHAYRRELAEPGWIARDVQVDVRFSDAVTEVQPWGDATTAWRFEGLGRGFHADEVYEVTLASGADEDQLVEVTWKATSPIEGEWDGAGVVTRSRAEVPPDFDHAPSGVRMAWVASAFAQRLKSTEGPSLADLYATARSAMRDGARSDVELVALIDRARRIEDDR